MGVTATAFEREVAMYTMRAEHQTTETGPRLLWHVLHREGRALCGRAMSANATVTADDSYDHEGYCTPCMDAVAAATAASSGGVRPAEPRV
ncbi:hypothetical protein ACIQMR_12710 [Streptomyces sp. NPDC091376]|uniref:hypothetical protein n=1 Tax=Streptomyces sp. NPDC091376 TaxID=3365994 RepID=UPI0038196366